MAYQFALHSPQITVDVVEVSEFPDMIQKYQVRAVPKTVINDRVAFDGALPEPLFLQKFLEAMSIKKLPINPEIGINREKLQGKE